MTYEQAMATLNLYVLSGEGVSQKDAAAAIAAIEEHVDAMRKRYADKELVRLGHIVRNLATPEQIYEATRKARDEHPEAWAGAWAHGNGAGQGGA